MKKIETTRQFDKDLKNLGLTSELIDVLHALINDLPVPNKYKDHALKPDMLLAYQTTKDSVKLIAVDNHNNLFKTLSNR